MELPDVVMPPPEVPEPSPDLAPPDEDDKPYEKDGDTSVNELQEVPQTLEQQFEADPQLKADLTEQALTVKPIIEDEEIFKEAKPKKKRVATEKQKQHLAKIRAKAMENRKAKAEEKRKEQTSLKAEREAKKQARLEALKEKEELRLQKLAREEVATARSNKPQFTAEDIKKFQQDAIEEYETQRKARKQQKKEALEKETRDKKTYEAVAKAVGPTRQHSVWDNCFMWEHLKTKIH